MLKKLAGVAKRKAAKDDGSSPTAKPNKKSKKEAAAEAAAELDSDEESIEEWITPKDPLRPKRGTFEMPPTSYIHAGDW